MMEILTLKKFRCAFDFIEKNETINHQLNIRNMV